jgi:hypothetical protein
MLTIAPQIPDALSAHPVSTTFLTNRQPDSKPNRAYRVFVVQVPRHSATMPSLALLASRVMARDDTTTSDSSNMDQQRTLNYAIVVLGLVFFGLLLVMTLLMFRRLKRQQQMRAEALPVYQSAKRNANHQGLTIQTTSNGRSSILVINKDGQPMLMNPESPPHSPDNIPEIHITFPDEQDEQGHKKSGRVVVVRLGEHATVGLEPVREEPLPAYEKEAKSQFYSINMDHIGGLKEKDRSAYH